MTCKQKKRLCALLLVIHILFVVVLVVKRQSEKDWYEMIYKPMGIQEESLSVYHMWSSQCRK